ncbi:MAG TPA: hypothetical protein VE778_05415 [Candidatus Bathyarchaeia archaeon]|nr:hypothetical protein [Candidatus Bathyarchaeia archaeon]
MFFATFKSRVVLPLVVAVALGGCSVDKSGSAGTSVVVLVDFSKSFAPLVNDERALQQLATATSELAQREWKPPVEILWSRIQTASLISGPLCGPFQFQQSLIKRDNDDSAQVVDKLEACAKTVVRASTAGSERSAYTDISGAVALAADQGQSVLGQKYIVIVSDFMEDLPPGKRPIRLQLNGERVLLLHRLGTEKTPRTLADHLARIQRWSEGLREAGAASVVALPLSSVTEQRIVRALGSGTKEGTDVVVLQNLPDTAQPDMVKTMADTLNKAARDWQPPVTVTWADVRDETAIPFHMPPLEFTPRLVKAIDSPAKDFSTLLNERAESMQRFSPGTKLGDLAGSLSFYSSAGGLDADHVLLIVSSFPNLPKDRRDLPLNLKGVRVAMLPAPNRADASDEDAYLARVAQWETWLKQKHANVCRIPFNGLTTDSLMECLHGS